MDMVRYDKTPQDLKVRLWKKKETLNKLLSSKELGSGEIEDLKRQLGIKFTPKSVEVYCPGCMSYHTFPYAPGRYKMCPTKQSIPMYKDNYMNKVIDTRITSYYELVIDDSYRMHMTTPSQRLEEWLTKSLSKLLGQA